MSKQAYPYGVKLACIEMKKAGKTNKVIKETLGIKNDSQIYTWLKWSENQEFYRLHQPVGKQYSYGKGMEHLSQIEQLELQVDLLKKYLSLIRTSTK